MKCYINHIISHDQVTSDIKLLIPDASLRRRMSRVVRMGVSTAVECLGGVEKIDGLDAIVTATGLGCLADSEKFLRNFIDENEQLLNPTPFIQSTFNTVGGQVALLRHNHCYNVTYVNRSHGFEDALLDVMMGLEDGECTHALVGAFDEKTESQSLIMERMGCYRKNPAGEGAVFADLTARRSDESRARIVRVDFPFEEMDETECRARYASLPDSVILYNDFSAFGIYPTVSARVFAKAVEMIGNKEAREVVIYNELFDDTPVVTVVQCLDGLS